MAEVALSECRNGDEQVWHAAIHVSQASAEFSHLVHLVNVLASEEVQTVEVGIVVRNDHAVAHIAYRKHGFEDGAFAILNPLTHRVEVGGEVNRCWENAQMVLTFAFTVELFPPFSEIVEAWAEIHQNFNLLASLIECVAGLSVGEHVFVVAILNFHSTSHESLHIVASHSDWEQAHRSEHREATAHIVGDNIGLVALLGGETAKCALLGIGDSHDALRSHFLALLLLQHVFQQTESDSRFGGSA